MYISNVGLSSNVIYDILLSSFAINLKLRQCSEGENVYVWCAAKRRLLRMVALGNKAGR